MQLASFQCLQDHDTKSRYIYIYTHPHNYNPIHIFQHIHNNNNNKKVMPLSSTGVPTVIPPSSPLWAAPPSASQSRTRRLVVRTHTPRATCTATSPPARPQVHAHTRGITAAMTAWARMPTPCIIARLLVRIRALLRCARSHV